MKYLVNQTIGIEQGEHVLFSDYEDGGQMWTGTGPRERRNSVTFSTPFKEAPAVHVSLSMWDMDSVTTVSYTHLTLPTILRVSIPSGCVQLNK